MFSQKIERMPALSWRGKTKTKKKEKKKRKNVSASIPRFTFAAILSEKSIKKVFDSLIKMAE